jgi:Bacterial proteasome activator
MGGTEATGERPGPEVVVPQRLAVIVGRAADASRVCRVEAPDRVLRIWALLSNAEDEMRQASMRPEVVARLRRQFDVLAAELERSLSPALAGELRRFIGPDEGAELSAGELRVEYATLLAWTASLVAQVLTQLEAASATIRRPGPRARLAS